ncbi:MAG TPA: chromosome segregation protein SMC [Opitutaceae bacterium]|nr:chromosome segregation protein SMC [Opitutaceae bacterium]HRE04989.1 chromosome segregation protein SMC [Opitutaceae bacterium]
MHLKALKLHGFKSFADPTTLRFEPGVTAVVGPNGCGKSNIADSIRWVLGEQSAKALRGGKMQDVIFEGADTRKPAQLCEVSLLLTDCEKQLGSEFHEIEIMRRVHRDGQGEYFFNGQPCRLKDIQKLFMDTGIGRTSYSIMAQGQIDQILSSKPEERRAVFEEAAGITKYKSQRREALQKLGLTDQNLARVADVIGEVGRQIGSLRRQASKALRYKRLSHRLRHLVLSHAGHQHAELTTTLAGLENQVISLRAAAETRRVELMQRQSALEEKRTERSRLNQRVQDAQQSVFDLRSQKEQAENQMNLAQIKRTGLSDRLESSRASLEELEMQLRELASQVDTGALDKEQQLTLLGSSDDVFQQRNRDLAIVEGELSKHEQELQQSKFQLLQHESTVARLRTDTTGYEVDQKTSAQRHDAVVQEIEGIRAQQASATAAFSEVEARVEEALVEKSRAHNEVTASQQAITDLTREFRDAQRKLQEIDRGLAQRTARLKLLQQLQERLEGFGEGAKAVLQGKLDGALAGSRVAPITHGLEIKPEYAKALEAILGSAVEAISVLDVATAQRILSQLEQEQIGAAVLRVGDVGAGRRPSPDALPPGLITAASVVGFSTDDHPVLALLDACYIAEDLNAFLDFWKTNPGFSFLTVAHRSGHLVDQRGLVSGGYHKKSAHSIMQREVDLRETAKALAEDQLHHDQQRALIDGLQVRLTETEGRLEQCRQDVLLATQTVAAVQQEQRGAQKALDEIGARLARMENEVMALEQARHEAQVRFERAQRGLTDATASVEALRERIAGLETRIVEFRTDRDVKRESLAQARLELAERRQRVEVLDRGLADMERRRGQLSELLVQRQQEIEVWSEQVTELEQVGDRQRAQAHQLGETLVVAQQQVEQIRRELVALEQSIGGVESGQFDIRNEADRAQAELNRCEIKLAESKQRALFIEEDVQREFQIRVGTYDWRALLWRADEEPADLKPLDLDDDEDEAEGSAPAAALAGTAASPVVTSPEAVSASGAEGIPVDPAAAAVTSAPATTSRRRKKKGPKPEPTEDDLKSLETGTDWAPLKTEIEALRQRLASMGAVNLVAIEEYAELKQRYDFLKNQNDDLVQAKTSLLAMIDEINQTSQQQFSVTFEQIKKNFVYTFQTLFGGGVANLELIQTDDVLESGIEITAQPPGTKLKSITLLSGGQKTLTAVALLFALYMVKPSPFCLLDELDAPLDESNIGRFTDLLKKFVHESQFIIITHNKRTVSAAQAIYGVTMEERGVSKTVSMKFNHLIGDTETAQQNMADAVRGAKSPHLAGA